jgi:GDP-L-fucose synthase
MKHVLLTGVTGFIGRNILPALKILYNVTTPGRTELNLLDMNAVKQYLAKGQFDAVLHLAIPTGNNSLDAPEELFERSVRAFVTLANCSVSYGKMIYIGSGAEYGKHRPLVQVREEVYGEEIPKDVYGFSRYIISELAKRYSNIINLRVFSCCGPGDHGFRLIPSVIAQARSGNKVVLSQDCFFDYLYVTDIANVFIHFIENDNKHSDYNVCSGERISIVTIAEEVCRQIGVNATVTCRRSGLNLEYTGSNARLRAELSDWQPLPMQDCIARILKEEIA